MELTKSIEYSDAFELLIVEVKIRNKEKWPDAERMPFFIALEQEIIKSQMEGKSIIIEIDTNS